ncbi:MAG: type III-B CRISPR-associated protein Cas10/Cmr2 [Tannerella sp.]|jgi:CRISPR-associated protein Cmr2|nr:type III-B CRISPR-associated protein Cas10/Cmr2 [Tannerella sp.]
MNYTALTIGPLYQTFSLAKKTREFWAGSFMFSLLMKSIIDQIEDKENIILPYARNAKYPELKSVGLYSDRLLYKGSIQDIDTIITNAIDVLASYMYQGSNSENEDMKRKAQMKELLSSYVQVYHFSSGKIEDINPDPERNYIERLHTVLDSLELESKITTASSIKGISKFYKYISKTRIYKEHYLSHYKDGTRSLVEIATHELLCCPLFRNAYDELRNKYIKEDKKQDENVVFVEDDNDFLNALKEKTSIIIKNEKQAKRPIDNLPVFKNHHKYIAVIYGDGDKMGQLIREVVKAQDNSLNGIHTVSSTLFEWAKASAEIIKSYGGLPVYVGGDDILCFAPIVNGKENIIDILQKISADFTDKFKEALKIFPVQDFPTLSFGVSITYYKFPLNEALVHAHHLIGEMKKNGGNGVNLKMLKHSGSNFHIMLKFPHPKMKSNSTEFDIFKNLMEIDFDDKMLSSTAYHLQNNESLLNSINVGDVNNESERNERIHNFFYNKMEGYPKDKEMDKPHFFVEVEKMIKHIYREGIDKECLVERKVKCKILPLYDMLRLVRFFKGLDKTF